MSLSSISLSLRPSLRSSSSLRSSLRSSSSLSLSSSLPLPLTHANLYVPIGSILVICVRCDHDLLSPYSRHERHFVPRKYDQGEPYVLRATWYALPGTPLGSLTVAKGNFCGTFFCGIFSACGEFLITRSHSSLKEIRPKDPRSDQSTRPEKKFRPCKN